METTQVQQLKLNATNIKSVLIKSNKELRRIKLQKRDLVNANIDREKKREKENKLESGIKSSLNKVKNAVLSGPMNIFDKIMEFAGIILLGILVNNLPTIISKLEGFFKKNSSFINGIFQVIKFIGKGIISLSGLVSSLFSGKQNKISEDRKKIDQDLGGLKKQLGDANSKANKIKEAINSKKKPFYGPGGDPSGSGKGQEPIKRAKGGPIPARKAQTTKSTSPAFTAGETGRVKRARQTTNYFGTFNQTVKDSAENSITDEKNLDLFEKMSNNFKKFSELIQASMTYDKSTDESLESPGSYSGEAIEVDPEDIIGYVGNSGSSTGPHIHIQNLKNYSLGIPQNVKNNIYVSGIPMTSRLSFTSGIGWRWNKMHKGEDYAGPIGQPITLRGGLKFVEYKHNGDPKGYGNYLVIQDTDGTEYLLGHLDKGPKDPEKLKKRQESKNNGATGRLTNISVTGEASYYGRADKFHGKPTSTGEIFNTDAYSAAIQTDLKGKFGGVNDRTRPVYALVENLDNGRKLVVKINDVGPLYPGRVIDLSEASSKYLLNSRTPGSVRRVKVTRLQSGSPGPYIPAPQPTLGPTSAVPRNLGPSASAAGVSETVVLLNKTQLVPYPVPYPFPVTG